MLSDNDAALPDRKIWMRANAGVALKGEVMSNPVCSVMAGGYYSTITKGGILGKGVCVAAGAAVGKSFPDGAIIGGVPAKLIRQVYL